MAKALCVLYDDPVDGYQPRYARDGIPTIDSYPGGRMTRTPEGIDFTPGELLGCVSGGWNIADCGAAMFRAKVFEGSTAVVFDLGLVGLGAVAGSRLMGAERIIAVDLSEDRLKHAEHHGATDLWVGGEGIVDRVLEETGGFGADFADGQEAIVGGSQVEREVQAAAA